MKMLEGMPLHSLNYLLLCPAALKKGFISSTGQLHLRNRQEFANVHVCLYSFAELAEFVKLFEKHLAMKGCIWACVIVTLMSFIDTQKWN